MGGCLDSSITRGSCYSVDCHKPVSYTHLRKFLAEHEADLELYRAAQAEMRSLLGGAKLPKMDVLKLSLIHI